MSKYVISKEVYTSIVKAAEKAKKFFANLTAEERKALVERITVAANNDDHIGWVANSVPLIFVQNEKNDNGKAIGLRPMTVEELLKVGPEAVREDGSAIFASVRDSWKVPRFRHNDQKGWLAAANLTEKGFPKPYLVRTDIWEQYYAPIRPLRQEEGEKRDELERAQKEGAPKNVLEKLEKEIEDFDKRVKAMNCLRFSTFNYWMTRKGGDYPFNVVFPEGCTNYDEAYMNSILGLRASEFSAWKKKFEEAMLERAKEAGEIYKDVTDVEEADRRMERWLEEHKTLEAEDEGVRRNGKTFVDATTGKVVTLGGMTKEECLIEAFKQKMNKVIRYNENVFGFEYLSEENERGSDHAGWGAIVRMGYLPSDYNEREAILANRSRWHEFVPNKEGKPANIWTLFSATGSLVGEGLPLQKYLAMTGTTLKEWNRFVSAKDKREKAKAENKGAFDAFLALEKANNAKANEKAVKAKADAVRLADAPF